MTMQMQMTTLSSVRPNARSSWRQLSSEASFLDYSIGCHALPSRFEAALRRKAERARRKAWEHMLDSSHPERRS
ncbi:MULTISPECIES: hypothetical protein [Acetobacter]|uniref:Uncharacterized protein n=1 Tax=Acetobacter cibinongensis TaxID=146475 RepID=A0A1Z5YV09_9PROT|nr:hypothetical protein [Acetobacter cibinongensis]OUJ02660.1 hypothetical protein HK14_05010 [Acetobacter cibinongensis]